MSNEFYTNRLVIRKYKPCDLEAVWRVLNTEGIYNTTYSIPRNYPKERVIWWFNYLLDQIKQGESYEFGMFDNITGEYIGNCGIIDVRKYLYAGAITYFVNPDKWNKGYATEAGEAMLDFAFNDLDLVRVYGTCMSKNPASRRVMEKLGFEYEGTAKCELFKDGEFIDVDHLSLINYEKKKEKEGTLCLKI